MQTQREHGKLCTNSKLELWIKLRTLDLLIAKAPTMLTSLLFLISLDSSDLFASMDLLPCTVVTYMT